MVLLGMYVLDVLHRKIESRHATCISGRIGEEGMLVRTKVNDTGSASLAKLFVNLQGQRISEGS